MTHTNPMDPVYWFNEVARERTETARRTSDRLRFSGRLEDHLNNHLLKPLEPIVRRDGLMLVEFTPGGLRLGARHVQDEITFRFLAEPYRSDAEIIVSLLQVRGDDATTICHWNVLRMDYEWAFSDISNEMFASMARAAGTAVADATYRQQANDLTEEAAA